MTDASVSTITGMITVATVVQATMIQSSHCPQPQINVRTWQNFEMFIKNRHGCLFDDIIGDIPVRHWGFNDLCNLLINDTPIYASTDGSVHNDLKSASVGWLFWSEADDADFQMPPAGENTPASPIVVLASGTKIVHGRFESITSYRAEGTGLLIIPFLVAQLTSFLNLESPPQINHNCDNQELIVKVNSMLPTKQAWWWYDVTDSDMISESLHWGKQIKWIPRCERGHPERREPDRRKWSCSE